MLSMDCSGESVDVPAQEERIMEKVISMTERTALGVFFIIHYPLLIINCSFSLPLHGEQNGVWLCEMFHCSIVS